MSKILICGDFHGDSYVTKQSIEAAARLGCDRIVQVGDFGWWPRKRPTYVAMVEEMLEDHGIDLFFSQTSSTKDGSRVLTKRLWLRAQASRRPRKLDRKAKRLVVPVRQNHGSMRGVRQMKSCRTPDWELHPTRLRKRRKYWRKFNLERKW